MSAKGRKGKQVEENEFYPTDPKVVLSLLESDLVDLPGGVWIEPCAGTGKIVSTVNRYRSDIDSWVICELNQGFDPYLQKVIRPTGDIILPYGDFVHREWPLLYKSDVLIMNPPFSLTMQFVQEAMKRAEWVVCLQRQAWFGSVDRSPWLREHCPDDFQLPFRPSFRPDGKKDNCDYCWYVWPPGSGNGRREGKIAMLDNPKGGQTELFG